MMRYILEEFSADFTAFLPLEANPLSLQALKDHFLSYYMVDYHRESLLYLLTKPNVFLAYDILEKYLNVVGGFTYDECLTSNMILCMHEGGLLAKYVTYGKHYLIRTLIRNCRLVRVIMTAYTRVTCPLETWFDFWCKFYVEMLSNTDVFCAFVEGSPWKLSDLNTRDQRVIFEKLLPKGDGISHNHYLQTIMANKNVEFSEDVLEWGLEHLKNHNQVNTAVFLLRTVPNPSDTKWKPYYVDLLALARKRTKKAYLGIIRELETGLARYD